MTAVPAPVTSALVARLRAAGCVYAEAEADLLVAAAAGAADLETMVRRRVEGLPLEQVVGWAEFCGRRVVVEPGVFVPRRRTEFLARQAVAHARRYTAPLVVDLCCGSGAIGAVLAAEVEGAAVHAADVDPVAVACARRNLPADRVHRGDLYAALPGALRGRVAVLVANAPYVPTGDLPFMPADARLHEAVVALDGGADGLDVQREVSAGAPEWLVPGGTLLVETSARQAPHTAEAMRAAGLVPRTLTDRDLDATVVTGTLPLPADDW
jgi:release factor glutamine methyltransferase